MFSEVVVVGAGGFGRETLDVLEAAASAGREAAFSSETGWVAGVADDGPNPLDLERLAARGVRYLGTIDDILEQCPPSYFVIGIGCPTAKTEIDRKFTDAGWKPFIAVHPNASIGSLSTIGEGSVICAGVQLSTNTTLGRHVHLNPNATIGHDSRLDDFVSINPAAVVSGEVVVEPGSLLGAGSVVLQGIRIGQDAVVGASACVVKDVDRDTTVIGVPARPLLSNSSQSCARTDRIGSLQ